MKMDESNFEDQLAQLPDRERARLALKLLESLTPGQDEDVDQLWLDEAERRLERFDANPSSARDFGAALSEIERKLG